METRRSCWLFQAVKMSATAANIGRSYRSLFCLSLLVFVNLADAADDWSYGAGVKDWPAKNPHCGGKRQSPINIDSDDAEEKDYLTPFDFDNYDEDFEDAKIKNNGHTVKVSHSSKDNNNNKMVISDGGLDGKYVFEQFHFHWGSNSKKGSEHLIDNKSYPLELHLVHRNTKYADLNAAVKHPDGLAVLGVLYKLTGDDNDDLKPIIDTLEKIQKAGGETDVDTFKLENLLPDDTSIYYRYEGSLTTPKCYEAVIWTVFKEFQTVGDTQMQEFRKLKMNDGTNMVDNFRPTRSLNGRDVYVSVASTIQLSATVGLLAISTYIMRQMFK